MNKSMVFDLDETIGYFKQFIYILTHFLKRKDKLKSSRVVTLLCLFSFCILIIYLILP